LLEAQQVLPMGSAIQLSPMSYQHVSGSDLPGLTSLNTKPVRLRPASTVKCRQNALLAALQGLGRSEVAATSSMARAPEDGTSNSRQRPLPPPHDPDLASHGSRTECLVNSGDGGGGGAPATLAARRASSAAGRTSTATGPGPAHQGRAPAIATIKHLHCRVAPTITPFDLAVCHGGHCVPLFISQQGSQPLHVAQEFGRLSQFWDGCTM
jgi:hypothetical protein